MEYGEYKLGEFNNSNRECQLTLSWDDTSFIRGFEGCRLTAYPDPVSGGDPWTIGYGNTGDWVVPGLTITQQEADDKFMDVIDDLCSQLDNILDVNVNKNQYIALIDFSYNLGIKALAGSTLLRKLNNNQPYGAAEEFLKWDHSCGKVIPGLTKRRIAEKDLFLTT